MARRESLRCAIYTRKSTEEGLDRAFNSLDAQREACAAYVASQRAEGWQLLPEYYDDGGYSGGSMDRPALQQLLKEVENGRIDIVVVYKVDRLTRSLTDFARIVQVLDKSHSSFVSVTQAFNTTTSMGRLTLNVLLSFAQFEREVIAERIRDKVAASKARGMWMGGPVPLGYSVQHRKLVPVPEEAKTVREIMQRYIASASVQDLLEELRVDGIVSKLRTARDGTLRGGIPFKRGALYNLLGNRLYIGEIVHKDKVYRGEHDAIVSRSLFNEVQSRLAERTNPRSQNCSLRIVSPLAGMIHDISGRPMSPTHTQRHGRRYRYYGTNAASKGEKAAVRLRAQPLEQAIRRTVGQLLTCQANNHSTEITATSDAALLQTDNYNADIEKMPTSELRELFRALELKIEVESLTQIHVSMLRTTQVVKEPKKSTGGSRWSVSLSLADEHRGHEARHVIKPAGRISGHQDDRLIALICRAFSARERLLAFNPSELGNQPASSIRHLERIARLSFLDPGIIRKIMDGEQPSHLTARYLSRVGALPYSWTDQRHMLLGSVQI